MSSSPVLYLFDPDGIASDALLEELSELGPVERLTSPPPPPADPEVAREEGEASPTLPPGWIFIPADTSPAAVLGLLEGLAQGTEEWSPLLLKAEEGLGGTALVPLPVGYAEPLGRALKRFGEGEMERAFLSFRLTLRQLSRIRHDLNNPLTAAMAEIQLLLMDVEPGSEEAESMQVVEAQLRRLRDLIAELTPLRVPRG